MGTPTRRWNALSVLSGALGEPSRAPLKFLSVHPDVLYSYGYPLAVIGPLRHHFRNLTFLDLAFPVSFPIYHNTAIFKTHMSASIWQSSARARQEQTAIKIFCPNNLWTYSFISYHGTYPTASLESASTMMPSDRNISIQLISFKLALWCICRLLSRCDS